MAVKNIHDVEELNNVQLKHRQLATSTYEALKHCAMTYSSSTALTFFLDSKNFKSAHNWNYNDLFSDITRAANAFADLGVGRDDVVAFILPNLPETHFTIWGGEAAGIVLAINPLLESVQIADLLRTSNAKVVVTMAPTPGVDLWPKLLSQMETLPSVRDIVWVGMDPYVNVPASFMLRWMAWRERKRHSKYRIHNLRSLMSKQPSDRLVSRRVISSGDKSSYFCTGGTTGLPKIAVRTHGSEVVNAWAMAAHLEPRKPGAKIFCGLPLFHVNAQLVTGLMPWTHGDQVIIGTPQGFRGEGVIANFWDFVQYFEINFFSAVPTVFSALLQHSIAGREICSLQYAICGAAPMPTDLFLEFEVKTGIRILEGYGLTEGTCVSSLNPPDGDRRIGSIGLSVAYQRMSVFILDDEGNYIRPAEANEVGVIAIRGPNVFQGYLDQSHNLDVWIYADGEFWLNTGDLGRQDTEGYFWLTGRKKELIIRGGHNIDPKLIEEALQIHPAVAMVAAVGSPDAHAGEVPVAYVQLLTGHATDAAELQEYASWHISERAAVPKRIEIVDSLPVTPVGKIFKPELQRREIIRIVNQEARALGIENIEIDVIQDSRRGLLAVIREASAHASLKSSLGRYSFQIDWV